MKESGIRDFIYLDIERIRSIVAQHSGGLPSERKSESHHDAGGRGTVEGSLPFLAKAEGEVNYHYLRLQSETRSLHDYIFSELYTMLENSNSFLEAMVPNADAWAEDKFVDGRLIIVTGLVKVQDYDYWVKLLQEAPNLIKISDKLTSQSSPEVGSVQNKRKNQIAQPDPFKHLPLKEMAVLFNQFYPGLVRIKVFPFEQCPDKVLVGSADKAMLRYDPVSLTNIYGPIVDAGWISVLQINKGIEHVAGELLSMTGNRIEDAFEVLTDNLSKVNIAAQGVKFPAVAVTPIAIYREI